MSSGSLYMGAIASRLRTPFDTWPASLRRISGGLGLRTRDNDITVRPSASLLSSRDIRGTQENPDVTIPDDASSYQRQTSWPQTHRCMCDTSNVHHLQYIFGTTCCPHGIYQQLILVYIQGIQHKIRTGYGCRVSYFFHKMRAFRDASSRHRRRTLTRDTSRSIVRLAPSRFSTSVSLRKPHM